RLASLATVLSLTGLLLAGMIAWQVDSELSRRRLEARSAAQDLRLDVDAFAFLLSTPDLDRVMLDEGLAALNEHANRYNVDAKDWKEGPLVRHLPPDERKELLATVGEMLWTLGRATRWLGLDRSEFMSSPARDLIRLAAECFPPDAVPPVI